MGLTGVVITGERETCPLFFVTWGKDRNRPKSVLIRENWLHGLPLPTPAPSKKNKHKIVDKNKDVSTI